MPYYIGDVIKDKNRLIVRTPEEFKKTGIDVFLHIAVEGIDTEKAEAHLSTGKKLPYDVLVLGTGANGLWPGIPGEDLDGVFALRSLTDGIRIKDFLNVNRCRKAVVIGAGFIAMEMAEAFGNIGISTQIIDILPLPVARWDAEFSGWIVEELKKNGAIFFPRTRPIAIERGTESRLTVKTTGGDLAADIVLVALGISSNVALAKSIGLKLGESGAIRVNFSQRTSREEIYSVGDCCEVFNMVSDRWVYTPLGDIANKQGRIAGQNIGGTPGIFPGIVGSQSFKVFGLEVAATGLNEADALNSGFSPVSSIIWGLPVGRSMSRGTEKLGLKLIADRGTGRLLGAQCVSTGEGAVKRIDTLSVALWNRMRLEELGYLDLAYSPAFGGAWDPIHIAAQNLAKKL